MTRNRSYYRYQRAKHISRKKRIIHNMNDYWHYDHEGILSKGKIHCSCWLCREKSYIQKTISDKRKIDHLNSEIKELA